MPDSQIDQTPSSPNPTPGQVPPSAEPPVQAKPWWKRLFGWLAPRVGPVLVEVAKAKVAKKVTK